MGDKELKLSKIPAPQIAGVTVKDIEAVEWDPHIPMIGRKAMKHAGSSGVIGPDAPCDMPDCLLAIGKHTHKDALALELESVVKNVNDVPGLKEYLLSIKDVLEKEGIVGVTFHKKRIPKTWPNYQKPAAYTLGSPGNACFGEPPNHPTHRVRAIYTSSGDSPNNPPYYYLNGNGYEQLDDLPFENKLPLEHERTQAWIRSQFRHMRHCYYDVDAKSGNTLIYPVPGYELKRFYDDPRFSEEWRVKEQASIAQANADIEARAKALATPDNHLATRHVRKYYPEFQPTPALIEISSYNDDGDWCETMETKPTPDKCPGDAGLRAKHPVNGSWCQVCGWHAEAKVEGSSSKLQSVG